VSRVLRVAALISGGGRTLINLCDKIDAGELEAEIALVIASREEAPGVEKARRRGLPVAVASRQRFPRDEARHDAISRWLVDCSSDLVCLCGYLCWLRVDEPFLNRVMNIHPALLPDFGGPGMYGERVHRAVLASGRTVSGCTVHFVDDQYDHGPIILQRTCPVRPDDTVQTLAARVFREECVAYPEAVRLFSRGRLRVVGGEVEVG
jgi:formyltetrahydrofolate-dependent phosphoribosylglycinamide formyltransferase